MTTHCLCTSHLFKWLLQINCYRSYLSVLLLQKPSVQTLRSFSWTLTAHQLRHTCKWGKHRICKLMKCRSIQHSYKCCVLLIFIYSYPFTLIVICPAFLHLTTECFAYIWNASLPPRNFSDMQIH